MELDYKVEAHQLRLWREAKTSRNTFEEKRHWTVRIWDRKNPEVYGIGEAAPIELLSPDYRDDLHTVLETKLNLLAAGTSFSDLGLEAFPSVGFAVESALLDLRHGGRQIYFKTEFLKGKPIPINGLVWMNSPEAMMEEALQKVNEGYRCIKFKVGSHDFEEECRFLEQFRKLPGAGGVEIRLDANGAFLPEDALRKLREFRRFHIHSVEQPIKQGRWEEMAELCRESPVPIALDEELIGIDVNARGAELLDNIRPQFIILKPTLAGGFEKSNSWIELAVKRNIGWWATSALEGNIGLNALAQWVAQFDPSIPQGLGTGKLYQNNFEPRSEVVNGWLYYRDPTFVSVGKV